MASPKALAAIGAAKVERNKWRREARLQKKNLGHEPELTRAGRLRAEIAYHRAMEVAFNEDVAHMGLVAAQIYWARKWTNLNASSG